MTEKDAYQFYNDKIKILYSEIEARRNTLPVELLFEINSAFDHLKRIHVDGESEEACAEKAFSHLKRGGLDALKLKLKYHNDDYEKMMPPRTDLRLIDNGNFLPALLGKRKEIIGIAKEARLYEGKTGVDDAFEKWYEVSECIDRFEAEFFDPSKIQWAKRVGIFHSVWKFIVGIIAGIIGSAIVQYFFPSLFKFLEK